MHGGEHDLGRKVVKGMPSEPRVGPGRNSATLLALVGLAVAAIGLLFLAALVAPHVLGVVVVACGFVLFGWFHYAVWGWWLAQSLSEDRLGRQGEVQTRDEPLDGGA